MRLTIIEKNDLAKTIFATLGISALVGAMLVFPSLGHLINQFTKDKKRQKYTRQVFRRLEKQDLISISEKPNGEVTINLTENGKQKALTYQIESMELKKPQKWDGIWRIVVFDIPEGKKRARDIFRENLKRLGFYQLQKSVFVCPYPCKNEVDFLKHNFGISSHVTFLKASHIDKQNFLRNHFQV